MKQPRLTDDGTTVELDVHGAYVDEAINLVRRVALLASERGRSTLRVVHGSSTSDPLALNRTIKHVLRDTLEDGIPCVASHFVMEEVTLLSLESGAHHDPTPITLFDFR